MNKRVLILFVYTMGLVAPLLLRSQELIELQSKPGVSLRGLSVLNDRFLWVSGSKGTVGRSTNGGKSFQWLPVKGYEHRDFRDIEAFSLVSAVIIAVDSPGVILRTIDGGESWQEVYKNNSPGIFMDAMSFWKDQEGMVIGDPIKGQFFLASTHDAGRSWREYPVDQLPAPDTGEACFASSGTNIQMLSSTNFTLVTGGRKTRVLSGNKLVQLPLVEGGITTGANSIAVRRAGKKKNSKYWVVVGGDFAKDTSRLQNCAITKNGGKEWFVPDVAPFGYRSSVVFLSRRKLVSCGTSGVDVSRDGGKTWHNISKTGYHVCQLSKKERTVYLAGGNGRIARLKW
jgi:photosystem II stability/assembly factor-like uncharacterized protein